MKRLSLLEGLLLIAGITLTLPAQAAIADHYELTRLGLTGTGYTNTSTGYQYSNGSSLNAAGQVAGGSQRYNATIYIGTSAWLYNGTTTQNIGLTGTGYTNTSTGYQSSSVSFLNDAGQVAGGSQRYNGSTSTGYSAWLFDGTTTQTIGLTGTGYTNTSTGYQSSSVRSLNASGQVAGTSQRYNGSNYTGESAWLFNGTTTQIIGLTGTGYTNTSTGYQYSSVSFLNAAGQAAGGSERYFGIQFNGQSAWLFNGTSTQIIGLTGQGYTQSSTGYQESYVNTLNVAGQAAGSSARFNGNEHTGRSAWLYNGITTQTIGLSGAGYTTNTGFQHSDVNLLNAAGQVAGRSQRYNGSNYTGESAWLYNGTTTQNIGLTGAGYTNTSNGVQNSSVSFLNDAGQVAGRSQRYNGSNYTGESAWLHNGTTTQNIGLTGTGYTRSTDGYQSSSVSFLNAAGQAAGFSSRYNGSNSTGQSAWFYDDNLNQTFAFDFSLRSDGYGYSQISYLGDDGLALGRFQLFDGSNDLGQRAYAWSLEDGFVDLGSRIDGGLGTDWSYLANAFRANALGQIVGTGTLAQGGQGVYLLTPVPEPETYAMLLAGLGLLGGLARRKVRAKASEQPVMA